MMILLYISFILLLFVEIFGEVIFGDKHDSESTIRLIITFVIAEFMGLLIGCRFGVFVYGFIRLAAFDLLFGKLFKGDWFYLGTSSKWDNAINCLPKWLMIVIRISSLTVSILIV